MHYGRTRGLETEVQHTDLACQRWGCHSNHNAASWICITLKSIFFPKETDVSFSSQHEAAWEMNRGCTIKVPCLQNHQLSCRRQEGLGEQGRHRTWWQGAAGLSSVPASARGYFRHIWQHFISEVPKMSCSVPAKFQTCARHQHESPNQPGDRPFGQPEEEAPPVTLHRGMEQGELLLPLPAQCPRQLELGCLGLTTTGKLRVEGPALKQTNKKTNNMKHTHVYLYRSHPTVSGKKPKAVTISAEQLYFVLNHPLNITPPKTHLLRKHVDMLHTSVSLS